MNSKSGYFAIVVLLILVVGATSCAQNTQNATPLSQTTTEIQDVDLLTDPPIKTHTASDATQSPTSTSAVTPTLPLPPREIDTTTEAAFSQEDADRFSEYLDGLKIDNSISALKAMEMLTGMHSGFAIPQKAVQQYIEFLWKLSASISKEEVDVNPENEKFYEEAFLEFENPGEPQSALRPNKAALLQRLEGLITDATKEYINGI